MFWLRPCEKSGEFSILPNKISIMQIYLIYINSAKPQQDLAEFLFLCLSALSVLSALSAPFCAFCAFLCFLRFLRLSALSVPFCAFCAFLCLSALSAPFCAFCQSAFVSAPLPSRCVTVMLGTNTGSSKSNMSSHILFRLSV